MRRFSGYVSTTFGMLIERVDQALQPARVPEVVVARPRKVFGVGMRRARDLESPARIVDQPEPRLVGDVGHARVGGRILARDRGRLVGRTVIDQHQREIGIGLSQDRLDRFAEVLRVVEERETR